MEDLSADALCGNCNLICDLFLQLLASADLFTDIIVIVEFLNTGYPCYEIWFCDYDHFGEYLGYAGLYLWLAHGCIRVVNEGASQSNHKSYLGDEDLCDRFIKFIFGVYIIRGVFAITEKVLRAVLAPLDPLLAIGFYSSRQEWACLIADNLFFFTKKEKNFFEKLSPLMKYSNVFTNVTAGGRWKVPLALDESRNYLDNANDWEKVTKTRQAKFIIAGAIIEEVFENVGAIMLAIGLALIKGSFSLSSTVSLIVSVVSTIVETGKYMGDFSKIGRLGKKESDDGDAKDEKEGGGEEASPNEQPMENEPFADDFERGESRVTSTVINTDGTVTVLKETLTTNGSKIVECTTYPDWATAENRGAVLSESVEGL
uniref:Uncharacterized protein n=1 Tax=Odontella aurita TaxID=265563 RepID=A0A7S4HHR1_9STRA|mmetsp:Transcript_10173/g.30075  ORF Transcript_10173/g.30075 Transcript_10173/m.30075 type:complete len:372 (+) Transcript_10173:257-1372(+)|eukprot:CAMPEP_0113579552 /NCGR_PEP_ID=MMETSP0015_2-20120614/30135_1 /TAXON_ID=2838 /ORGANISM="Odontella" /LENGTH=371 /DNA_ID=CAMNT_0000483551 /DNA_START=138 /DNA_END=1253 /DNA_ORIENTATION=+ /assembly_acc=CAM_ASM_000160